MITFKCTYCNKEYEFKVLPIPEEGAEFKCSECEKTNKLLKKGDIVYCLELESPDQKKGFSTMDMSDSFQSSMEDRMSPDELESRLQGLYTELPVNVEFRLGVMDGPDQGTTFALTKPINTIGKSGTDIELTDDKVDREHCQIEIYGNQMIILRDLGSVSGTFRNSDPAPLSCLHPGDNIEIGSTKLVLIQTQKKIAED